METASQSRINLLNQQFEANVSSSSKTITLDDQSYPEVIDYQPSAGLRSDYFKRQGWGYKDTEFIYDPKKNIASVTGKRYLYSGKNLVDLVPYAESQVKTDFKHEFKMQSEDDVVIQLPQNINHEFVKELDAEKCYSRRSFDAWERCTHSHGASLRELMNLRVGTMPRVVDMVYMPKNTEQTEQFVQLAHKHNVMVIPYGGGTNVTQALYLKQMEHEKRMIVSLDMSRMNKVQWIDRENMIACVQAGIRGQDLERDLKSNGVVCGHEPDSMEFSTLGGWISTRASGMKKNTYGNIEDIVCGITLVTPKGTYRQTDHWPRISAGPDFKQVIMGHEGNFGVITDAIIRLRKVPEVSVFNSLVFPNFDVGRKFMEEMGRQQVYPTSLRLIDNLQFQFGNALKPEPLTKWDLFKKKATKFFLTQVKGFDPDQMVAATVVFEGEAAECKKNEKNMVAIAKKYGAIVGGPENGKSGYQLTYMIAYIRDIIVSYAGIAESFETSCAWSQVGPLCKNLSASIKSITSRLANLDPSDIWVSFRITQLYETGAAVYVYFALNYQKIEVNKAVEIYEQAEAEIRFSVMKYGGSISHHHGVGKLRKRFMEHSFASFDLHKQMFMGLKNAVDPKNIFGVNNTLYRDEAERAEDLKIKI